ILYRKFHKYFIDRWVSTTGIRRNEAEKFNELKASRRRGIKDEEKKDPDDKKWDGAKKKQKNTKDSSSIASPDSDSSYSPMANCSLVVENLSVRYKDVQALQRTSWRAPSSRITGLIGPNGSGKTTTLNTLLGCAKRETGEIFVCGIQVNREVSRWIRRYIGVTPQANELIFPELTPYQHLNFMLKLKEDLIPEYERNETCIKMKIERQLEIFGILDKRDVPADYLSGGMKRRLLCSMSTVGNPIIIFLDECTTGLDCKTKREAMWPHIRDLKSQEKTVILTSHDMAEVEELCDIVVHISKGKVIHNTTPSELLSNHLAWVIDIWTYEGMLEESLKQVEQMKMIIESDDGTPQKSPESCSFEYDRGKIKRIDRSSQLLSCSSSSSRVYASSSSSSSSSRPASSFAASSHLSSPSANSKSGDSKKERVEILSAEGTLIKLRCHDSAGFMCMFNELEKWKCDKKILDWSVDASGLEDMFLSVEKGIEKDERDKYVAKSLSSLMKENDKEKMERKNAQTNPSSISSKHKRALFWKKTRVLIGKHFKSNTGVFVYVFIVLLVVCTIAFVLSSLFTTFDTFIEVETNRMVSKYASYCYSCCESRLRSHINGTDIEDLELGSLPEYTGELTIDEYIASLTAAEILDGCFATQVEGFGYACFTSIPIPGVCTIYSHYTSYPIAEQNLVCVNDPSFYTTQSHHRRWEWVDTTYQGVIEILDSDVSQDKFGTVPKSDIISNSNDRFTNNYPLYNTFTSTSQHNKYLVGIKNSFELESLSSPFSTTTRGLLPFFPASYHQKYNPVMKSLKLDAQTKCAFAASLELQTSEAATVKSYESECLENNLQYTISTESFVENEQTRLLYRGFTFDMSSSDPSTLHASILEAQMGSDEMVVLERNTPNAFAEFGQYCNALFPMAGISFNDYVSIEDDIIERMILKITQSSSTIEEIGTECVRSLNSIYNSLNNASDETTKAEIRTEFFTEAMTCGLYIYANEVGSSFSYDMHTFLPQVIGPYYNRTVCSLAYHKTEVSSYTSSDWTTRGEVVQTQVLLPTYSYPSYYYEFSDQWSASRLPAMFTTSLNDLVSRFSTMALRSALNERLWLQENDLLSHDNNASIADMIEAYFDNEEDDGKTTTSILDDLLNIIPEGSKIIDMPLPSSLPANEVQIVSASQAFPILVEDPSYDLDYRILFRGLIIPMCFSLLAFYQVYTTVTERANGQIVLLRLHGVKCLEYWLSLVFFNTLISLLTAFLLALSLLILNITDIFVSDSNLVNMASLFFCIFISLQASFTFSFAISIFCDRVKSAIVISFISSLFLQIIAGCSCFFDTQFGGVSISYLLPQFPIVSLFSQFDQVYNAHSNIFEWSLYHHSVQNIIFLSSECVTYLGMSLIFMYIKFSSPSYLSCASIFSRLKRNKQLEKGQRMNSPDFTAPKDLDQLRAPRLGATPSEITHKMRAMANSKKDSKDNAIILGVDRVFYSYENGFQALKNVTFSIDDGHCYCLLGVNGSGKSTCCGTITGQLQVEGGAIYIDGESINDSSESMTGIVSSGIVSICPQHDMLWPKLSCQNHLKLISSLHGSELSEEEMVLLFNLANLQNHRHLPAEALSGGMKRRLSLIMAFSSRPRILIADEPTSGLDPVMKRGVWRILSIGKTFSSVLLTTHSLDEAEALSTDVGVLHRGKMIVSKSPKRLRSDYGREFFLNIMFSKPTKDQHDRDIRDSRLVSTITSILPSRGYYGSDLASVVYVARSKQSILTISVLKSHFVTDVINAPLRKQEEFDIIDVFVTLPSLEETFLSIIHEVDEPKETKKTKTPLASTKKHRKKKAK
ncbi:ABC transporter A like protein, partial [Aduncisulcus paluster]